MPHTGTARAGPALPPLVSCTNTKSLLDHRTFDGWARELRGSAGVLARLGFVVLVPAQLIDRAAAAFAGSGIAWGAQDLSPDDAPPTGDIPAAALAAAGVCWVMTGHPERRAAHAESDRCVALKAAAAARHGLVPLVCVGEPEAAPPAATERTLRRQAEAVLDELPPAAPVVWLYEPPWTSSARTPAPPATVARAARLLHASSERGGHPARVLYGGAVGPGIVRAFAEAGAERPPLDGAGLGRAAHDPAQRDAVLAELLAMAGDRAAGAEGGSVAKEEFRD
jgi:triosephosphate isomerase